jgi:hypothetical protein
MRAKTPGPDDAIRVLQIYENGRGDWTKDRKTILEQDPETIIRSIMAKRKNLLHPDRYSTFTGNFFLAIWPGTC